MRHPTAATPLVTSRPPPRAGSVAVLLRMRHRVRVRLVTVPADTAPPARPAELPVNEQSVKEALPPSTRRAPPRLDAVFPLKMQCANVGLALTPMKPAPRSSGVAPSALPPLIV